MRSDMFDLKNITRENIWTLKPYSSARDEYTGKSAIFLDANENPFESPYNRYPDPQQRDVKQKISELKNIDVNRIFLGNGSDEPIDLLYRVFCEPGVDNVIIPNPTYGMYQVCADINNSTIQFVSLNDDFSLNANEVLNAVDKNTKLIFICSPNNPTSNTFEKESIVKILDSFKTGIVVVDEAYIDFSAKESFLSRLDKYPNLVVLQTFSKAWGLAGIRLGMAFASKEIIALMTKVKYPYNINILTQNTALKALNDVEEKNTWVIEILEQRKQLEVEFKKLGFTEKILKSDTNFIMLKVNDPEGLYKYLIDQKIIVRDRSKVHLCMGYLRITVGTPEENKRLLEKMSEFDK